MPSIVGRWPVNNAVVWHVDKSALPLSEPRRYRDRAHLDFVASQACLQCERQPSEPHYLRFVQPRALAILALLLMRLRRRVQRWRPRIEASRPAL
jgi:hypothetical protein